MSVCPFGISELANIAAAILNDKTGFQPSDRLQRVCDDLALISQANLACFNDKYSATHLYPDAHQIEKALVCVGRNFPDGGRFVCDLEGAISAVGMIHYNCDDEGGDFLLKVEGAHAALIRTVVAVMRAVALKTRLR